jgi:hypothetical protein
MIKLSGINQRTNANPIGNLPKGFSSDCYVIRIYFGFISGFEKTNANPI